MPAFSPQHIPTQADKIAIITGANNGLGYESARILAEKGATVIMAVRTVTKGKAAAEDVRRAVPQADVRVMELDLADLASVRAFADAFNADYARLDILMNNAGVMATPQKQTTDGFELQLGTNHLGHFALTGHLLERLLNTANSRIVNVSSMAANNGKMNFDDLMLTDGYTRFSAYAQSKLANLLFTLGLKDRLDAMNADTIATAAHPGVANTNLASGMMGNNSILVPILRFVSQFTIQTAEKGALPQLYAATMPDVPNGAYYGPKNGGFGETAKVNMPSSVKTGDIEKLWQVSEQLTGVTYAIGEPA